MRIVEQTSQRLTLEDRPWVLGSILAVVILFMVFIAMVTMAKDIFVGIGVLVGAALFAVAFVIFVRRVIVIFDRAAGVVVIRTATLLGKTETTHPLTNIGKASVEASPNRSNTRRNGRLTSNRTYRPVLQGQGGTIVLNEIYSSGSAAENAVAVINRWLGASEGGQPPIA